MDRLNMTGESTQQNPPSVFGFDPYPPQFQLNWNQSNPFGAAMSPTAQFPPGSQSPMCSPSQPVFPTQFAPVQLLPQSNHAQTISPNTAGPSQAPPMGGPQFGFNVSSISQPQPSYTFGPKPYTSQEVVQFPFQVANSAYRCKRKTDSPPLQPNKQLVTEEKMAEHMSKLHISSQSVPELESKENKIQRLYMCEEMRKLQTEPLLPSSIIHRMSRPCTALVLWRPPNARPLPPGDDDANQNNNNNNNESEMQDNNVADAALPVMDMDNC
nr:unnamed protein product [Callosobruchus chinensis]